MPIVFFVSSAGDTDLATAAISRLVAQDPFSSIYLVPVAAAAETRIQSFTQFPQVKHITLSAIVSQPDIAKKNVLDDSARKKLASFITDHNIQRAYVGVASPVNEELPYQIAQALDIPCTIAYEYMFNAPDNHPFWHSLNAFAARKNLDIAVPLPAAKEAILKLQPGLDVKTIGHISIDRALNGSTVNAKAIKESLQVNAQSEMIFISGTTQKIDIDNQFLQALLEEIDTGNHPAIQIRFGLHPSITDKNTYMQTLLTTCAAFPNACKQLKIILPDPFAAALNPPVPDNHPFIIRSNAAGADVAAAADKVAQAVPGALLNEAAVQGKPAYFHNKTVVPYLPEAWFLTQSIHSFFCAQTKPPHNRNELGIDHPAGEVLAKLMKR